jgi:hypothetical protein
MRVRTECVRGRVFATRAEAILALFEYIDGFYNSRRIQERLGFLSPIEFEEKHYTDQATAEQANVKPHQPALTCRSVPPTQRGNLRVRHIPWARCEHVHKYQGYSATAQRCATSGRSQCVAAPSGSRWEPP